MTVNRKIPKLLLILILLATVVFPLNVFAATGDINSIEFDSSAKVELTVGQTPKQLKVFASVEGSSSKKDVTAGVVWNSSNSNVVQVVGGLLTPLTSGTSIIRATYNNALTTIEVTVTYPFKELKLEHIDGSYKLGDEEDRLLVKAKVIGGETTTSSKDVTADAEWSSSNTNVLTISAGKVTLVGEGKSTITAKYKGLTATYKAEVQLPYSGVELKQNGTAVKELEMLIGDNAVKLAAITKSSSGAAENDISAKAEWTSSNTDVATVKEGEIKVLTAGKTVITVSYLGVTTSVDVYVRAPYEALQLAPEGDQAIFLGESLHVKAEVRNAANSTLNVSQTAVWSSDNQLAATVAPGGETAVITAKAVGTTTIKAEYLGIHKTFKLTAYPTVTALGIEDKEQKLYTGDSASLPAVSGTKLDGTKLDLSKEVEWTSANEAVALIRDGKIVAEAAGTVKIIGTLKDGNVTSGPSAIRSQSVEVNVTVQDKVLVLIGPEDNLKLVTGEEQPLPIVKAVMENGDERDVTATIVWTVTGTNAVIKQGTGAKVLKGLTKGSASLKGTYSNQTLTIPLTIEQKVVKLVVEPADLVMNIKGSKTIKVTGYYSNGKTANFSSAMNWESSNPAVATVKGTSVKAVTEGTTTITGSYQGITASVKVTVIPKLTKLTVNEKKLKLAPGVTQTVVVTALYDTGKTANVTGNVTWTSSKPSVAKVSAGGVITAVSKGTASIKGKYNNKTVTVSVSVK
ncbi:Ig-like domain-containing protein [Paenibacillus albidus]|uniref:Ig-like domain-containing protein n=1 Tax=Paenibacillus albidus TaxID=2041023 RepID=UPI001BEA5E4E|nr:Ig-like domain-containing protein [Paenibacillus albidus]MBT2288132.1 Ig-like domain-containing protein [Paenibacillus albidus]